MVERWGRKGGEIEGERGRVIWGDIERKRRGVGGCGVGDDAGNSHFPSTPPPPTPTPTLKP